MPRFSLTAWVTLLLGFFLHFTPDSWSIRSERWFSRRGPLSWAVAAAATAVACSAFGTGESLAFVYYQF